MAIVKFEKTTGTIARRSLKRKHDHSFV